MNLFILLIIGAVFALLTKSNVVVGTGLSVPGLRSEFMDKFRGVDTLYDKIATRIPSNKDSENYKWLGTVPNMREWGTGRLAKGLRTESYSVENLKYEATIEVDRDEISDDQTGQIRIRVGELAQHAASHKDYLLGLLLANGSSAGYNAYDGLPFFEDGHISGNSGSQNNDLTLTAGATTKTVAECKAALTKCVEAMMEFKNDQGEPMNITPSGLMVLTPPSLYFTFLEAVNASVIAATTNTIAGLAQVRSFPWLTGSTVVYVVKTDGIIRPFIFQDREPIEFQALTDDSEESFKREKFLYGVRARYRMTYGYWQYAVKLTFSQ